MSGKTRRSRSEARFFGDARTMNGQHFDSLESRDTLGVGHRTKSRANSTRTRTRNTRDRGRITQRANSAKIIAKRTSTECKAKRSVVRLKSTDSSIRSCATREDGCRKSSATGSKKRSRETKRETLYIGEWWRNRAHRTILECPKSVTSCTIRTKTCSTSSRAPRAATKSAGVSVKARYTRGASTRRSNTINFLTDGSVGSARGRIACTRKKASIPVLRSSLGTSAVRNSDREKLKRT